MENYEKLNTKHDVYVVHTRKFNNKKPNKKCIKSFKLELLRQNETKKMYKCTGSGAGSASTPACTLEENFGTLSEYYPLTNNEILSILEYYDVFHNLDVVILHYKQQNIQAFVSQEVKGRANLTLKIPSKLAQEQMMPGLRSNALLTLLHECSHLLGNMKDPKPGSGESGASSTRSLCEREADRFGMQEFKKWKHVIDLTDNNF